jgi:hypothetical protein
MHGARKLEISFFTFLYKLNTNVNEENNQQNALINSSINLLMSDHSDMLKHPTAAALRHKHTHITTFLQIATLAL